MSDDSQVDIPVNFGGDSLVRLGAPLKLAFRELVVQPRQVRLQPGFVFCVLCFVLCVLCVMFLFLF